MRGSRLQLAAVALIFSLILSSVVATEHRIVGTDLLGVEFSKALYEFGGRSSIALALALDGSRPGLAELLGGRADLGLLVLPPGEEGAVEGFHALTVAYCRVVVLAPADCALEGVTLQQLAGIFGRSGVAHVERWGDLGLKGEWAVSPILALAPEVGTGIAVELFSHLVLGRQPLKPNVARYRTAADLRNSFAGDAHALALAGDFPAGASGIKVIAVAARPGAPAFRPEAEHLHSGQYGLCLPVRLLVRREARAPLTELAHFLCSDEAAPLFERAGLVPLPPGARRWPFIAAEKAGQTAAK